MRKAMVININREDSWEKAAGKILKRFTIFNIETNIGQVIQTSKNL